jgi:DNA-binding NtrC family response regulator
MSTDSAVTVPPSVLVVDDDAAVCWALERLLTTRGHRVLVANSAAAALRVCARQRPGMVISDVRMPGGSGLGLLETLRATYPGLPVVVTTAYGSVDVATTAMSRGAFEFLPKPLDLERTLSVVRRALGACRMAIEVEPGREVEPALIGSSWVMQELFRRIALAAAGDLPVLVSGPTGSGKELVARLLHRHGRRPDSPFVVVDCGVLSASSAEQELFGTADGSPGLIRQAMGGTLLLDEVGDLPPTVQAALLRVLENIQSRLSDGGEVTRVVALTNRDLGLDGAFRRDLLHRLAGATLVLPALSEHAEDIPLIAAHLLARTATRTGRNLSVTEDAMSLLRQHTWPGNVRELRQILAEAALVASGGIIDREHLRLAGNPQPAERQRDMASSISEVLEQHPGQAHRRWLDQMELPLFTAALAKTAGNQLRAAELLGIHRTTLRRRAQELGLAVGRGDDSDGGSM